MLGEVGIFGLVLHAYRVLDCGFICLVLLVNWVSVEKRLVVLSVESRDLCGGRNLTYVALVLVALSWSKMWTHVFVAN